MLLSERITEDKITCTSVLRDPPDGESPDMTWFNATLHLGRRSLTVPWGMSPLAGSEPGVNDVMSLLTMGVRTVENSRNLEEWCDEWGRDPEKEQETYDKWCRISTRLRKFLGAKFQDYLWDTQDDN